MSHDKDKEALFKGGDRPLVKWGDITAPYLHIYHPNKLSCTSKKLDRRPLKAAASGCVFTFGRPSDLENGGAE